MSQYLGQDVSVKSVSICIVDAQGTILARGETTSDPDQITFSPIDTRPTRNAWCMKAAKSWTSNNSQISICKTSNGLCVLVPIRL